MSAAALFHSLVARALEGRDEDPRRALELAFFVVEEAAGVGQSEVWTSARAACRAEFLAGLVANSVDRIDALNARAVELALEVERFHDEAARELRVVRELAALSEVLAGDVRAETESYK